MEAGEWDGRTIAVHQEKQHIEGIIMSDNELDAGMMKDRRNDGRANSKDGVSEAGRSSKDGLDEASAELEGMTKPRSASVGFIPAGTGATCGGQVTSKNGNGNTHGNVPNVAAHPHRALCPDTG